MNGEWPEYLTDRLRGLVAEGHSAGQIARTLKVTRNAVIGELDRIGLKLRNRRAVAKQRTTAVQQDAPVPPSPPRRFSWQDLTAPDAHA